MLKDKSNKPIRFVCFNKNESLQRGLRVRCLAYTLIITSLLSLAGTSSTVAAPLPKWANAPQVQEVNTLLLRDAILRSFGRSPSVTQAAAQVGIGEAQIDEAKSAWMPQISLGAASGHSKTTDSSGQLSNSASYGLTLTQLLYDFGKTSNSIAQQKTASASYYYRLLATMTDTGEKTALAYLQVKRYQSLCAAVQDTLASLEDVKVMAELRSEAGLSSHSDTLQAKTRIASMKASLQQYKSQLDVAKSQLSVLTGIRAGTLPDLPKELLNQPVIVDRIAYQTNPLVQASQAQQNAARYGVEIAKSQYWPTLSLQGGRTRYEGNKRNYWNDEMQLSMEMPVYQGGATSARIAQAEWTRKAAESQVYQTKLDISQKAEMAFANWVGAREREEAGQVQFFTAITTRDVYKNEYKLGKRSLNDLLSVEQDIFQALTSQVTADYDGWDSAVTYAAAVDNLLPLLNIVRKSKEDLPEL